MAQSSCFSTCGVLRPAPYLPSWTCPPAAWPPTAVATPLIRRGPKQVIRDGVMTFLVMTTTPATMPRTITRTAQQMMPLNMHELSEILHSASRIFTSFFPLQVASRNCIVSDGCTVASPKFQRCVTSVHALCVAHSQEESLLATVRCLKREFCKAEIACLWSRGHWRRRVSCLVVGRAQLAASTLCMVDCRCE